MKSSISSFARFFCVRPQVGERAVVEHGPHFQRFQSQRAMRVAHAPQRLRGPVLDAQLLLQPGHRRELWRRRRRAFEPRGDAVVGKLGAIEDDRPVDVGAVDRAVGGDRHVDHDRQPLLAFAQRREIGRESSPAASGRFPRACRRRSCWSTRGRRSRSPF